MMQLPWDRAQPDEWLPRNLRLCWGSGGGDGGGGGWGDSGGGTTGGGDWGSSGSYDASGFNAGGDLGAWAGSQYDSASYTGGGGGDWGSFGATNYSGMNAPNPTYVDVAGPNPGVTTGGGDWGSAGAFSAAGTGGGPGGAMFGATQGASGGFWGDTGGGGGLFGGGGGGGGGGGRSGGGSFGSFGHAGGGPTGSSSSGYAGGHVGGGPTGSTSGGPAVTAGGVANPVSAAPDADPDAGGGKGADPDAGPAAAPDADPDAGGKGADPDAAPLGTPTTPEAPAPEAAAAPSLSDAAPSGNIGGGHAAAGHATQTEAAPAQTETSAPTTSAFGPQSLSYDYQGAPYADMGPQAAPQASFDSRFGDWGQQPAVPSQAYQDAAQQLSNLTQSALDPGQPDYQGAPYANMGPEGQQTAPDFNQAFQAFEAQPGWNPAEQTAGRAGLAEPTDWAANPYQPSTDVSVGRDFNQAFDPFANTPTGMDLAGDQRSETEPALTFNEMWGTTPHTTLPSDPLSRSAQQTLEHDFSFFPNPGYVQGPPQQTLSDRIDAVMNAIIDPVSNVTMYPFTRGLDYFMNLPNPLPPGTIDPITAVSNFAQNTLLGGSNIQSLNPDAFLGREVGEQGKAGANPDTTPWGSVFEGAAPTEAQPSIESFIPGGRETNFDPTAAEVLDAQQTAPVNVDVVSPGDPGVPADPRGDPAAPPAPPAVTLPPPGETPESGRPAETAPSRPGETPANRPAEQPQAPPPSETPQAQPGVQVTPQVQRTETPQAQPGLVDMLPPAFTPTPQVRPTETPQVPPQEQPAEPGEPGDHNAPEPGDTSQPPQDPNAPRPPGNVPGQLIGSRGTYQNQQADNPQTNRNYRDSGRTDYPQGRPGVNFRTARQAGIEPQFRIGDVNVGDLDARLVENINRAMADMPANIRGTLEASSAYRPAHRGEAIEHGMDPRTSQESVYSRGHPSSGRGGFISAQPGNSNHGHGRAIDFNSSPALTWLRSHARQYGLETIANDHPHIQLRGARGNVGARPSAQEQAEQRAIDAQTRQAAIDRGLIAPGRGQAPAQQAGVPTPRARPSDAPQAQPDVAQPRPPADIPPPAPPTEIPTALPPQVPQETRPPADIPAPILTPPRAGRLDIGVVNNALQRATAHLNKNSGEAEFAAASVVSAKDLARAGVPLAVARSEMQKGAYAGAAKNGYDINSWPMGGVYKSKIDAGIEAALQGYQPAKPGQVQGPPAPEASLRGLAKGGHVAKDEPVMVGEEGPEFFVPDQPGTVWPHMPQPGKTGKTENIDRWPKLPAPNYPGRYGGVEREMLRQTRSAQDPMPGLMDMIDSGRLPLNEANWRRMISDPDLIAQGRSRMEDRREGIDPGAEQYGAFMPAPEPAAQPPDPANPMAQALGYGSIARRPVRIGRQIY